jgi:hypothetical protein
MLRPEEIRDRLRQQPFVPQRIFASEGLRYDILHPDLVIVGDRELMIGISRGDSEIASRFVRLALIHVVALEDLVPLAKANEHEA